MDHRHYKLPVARTRRLTRRTHRTVDDSAWSVMVWMLVAAIVLALSAWDLWGILLHLE